MIEYQHQTIEKIVDSSSPAQRIIWNQIFLRYGERCAVVPMMLLSSLFGDLGLATPRRLYYAYILEFSSIGPTASHAGCTIIDDFGSPFFASNHSPYWNATTAAPNFVANVCTIKDILFSRLTGMQANYFRFVGYRISY